LKNNGFDPQNYKYFESANHVFLHLDENIVIALSDDFRKNVKQNVILSIYAFELPPTSEPGNVLEQKMEDLNINYEIVDLSLRYADIPSPKRKYIARKDGIYLLKNNFPVTTREYINGLFMTGNFRSWYYDESAVVFAQDGYYYYNDSLLGNHFSLPRPILKLNLPTP